MGVQSLHEELENLECRMAASETVTKESLRQITQQLKLLLNRTAQIQEKEEIDNIETDNDGSNQNQGGERQHTKPRGEESSISSHNRWIPHYKKHDYPTNDG